MALFSFQTALSLLIGVAGLATSATREAAAAPPTECADYLQQVADAAVAIGDANGQATAYKSFLENLVQSGLPPDFTVLLKKDYDKASQDARTAQATAVMLGHPPVRCGFERASVTKPGIELGQQIGMRAGEQAVVSRIAQYDPTCKRAFCRTQLKLTDKYFSLESIAKKRADYNALLAKIRTSFAGR